MGKRHEETFHQKGYSDSKAMKRCSALVIRGIQSKNHNEITLHTHRNG